MNKLTITEIDKEEAIVFIHQYHYSKILPRLTKYYLGVYEHNILKGVITLGWGTQPLQTIKKIIPNQDVVTNDYLEIGKMCFSPDKNKDKNFGSRTISTLIKWLKQNTDCKLLYTLADGIMGKVGYVYQASNFRYIGSFKTSVYRDRNTGEKIHSRSAKGLCKENAELEGKEKVFWLTHDFCDYKQIDKINGLMFRYILPLNKEGKKLLKGIDTYDYPKDKDLSFSIRVAKGKFETLDNIDFNMDVFNHNYQKY